MRTNRRFRVVLAVVANAALVGQARASAWYPQMTNGDHVTACVEMPYSIDQIWAALNEKFGVTCEYPNDARFRVLGIRLTCGLDNAQYLFRSRQDCETFETTINERKKLDVLEFVPPGVVNRDGWLVAYDGCMRAAATPSNISKLGLQWVADYCLCTSNELGANTRTDEDVNAEIATHAVDVCAERASGRPLTPEVREAVHAALERAVNRAKGRRRGASVQARRPRTTTESTGGAIKRGESYSDVMRALAGIRGAKNPYGDFLDVTYTDPSLLAYPDAGGECKLTFDRAHLAQCSGCDPARFRCE